jgi:hypothetical protein
VRLALLAFLAAAAPAWAQAPAEKEPVRKPLNLDLDDAMRSQPVIRFGPAAEKKEAGSSLPGLGADARKMEAAPERSDSPRRPYPQDTEMQNR